MVYVHAFLTLPVALVLQSDGQKLNLGQLAYLVAAR